MRFFYSIKKDTLVIRSADKITSRADGLFLSRLSRYAASQNNELSGILAPYVPHSEGYQLTKPAYSKSNDGKRYVYFSNNNDSLTHESLIIKRKSHATLTMAELENKMKDLAHKIGRTILTKAGTNTFNFTVFDQNPHKNAKLQSCSLLPQYTSHCQQQVVPITPPSSVGYRF